MQTTTKLLNQYRNPKMVDLSLEQLSSLYRQKKQDAIIAEAFDRIKRLIFIKSNQYPQLDSCDTISIALEKLEMCLLTYVPGSRNKFSTYFAQVYGNKLVDELESMATYKRCIRYNSTSLNYMMEQGIDFEGNLDVFCDVLYLPKNLSHKEKLYCYLIGIDYGTNKEIAEYMNVSTMTLCNLRKSLRVKLAHLYN